jgi:hypothetical protein
MVVLPVSTFKAEAGCSVFLLPLAVSLVAQAAQAVHLPQALEVLPQTSRQPAHIALKTALLRAAQVLAAVVVEVTV